MANVHPTNPALPLAPPSVPLKKKRTKPPPAVHLLAGGLGGMCGSVVTAPFDVVKTRLQSDMFHQAPQRSVHAVHARSGVRALLYNFVDTGTILKNVYKHEGPTALFKGLGPTLAGVVPGRSINFFVYGNGKHLYAEWFNDGRENTAVHLAAAASAGIVTAAATNPIWVVKTVMQLQQQERPLPRSAAPTTATGASSSSTASPTKRTSSRPLPSGPPTASGAPASAQFSHSFRSLTSPPLPLAAPAPRPTSYSTTLQIYRTEGVRGFYKGLSASLLGVTEGTIQWSLYEQFKRIASDSANRSGGGGAGEAATEGWRVSVAAGMAKLVATVITYPHEVIRTRLRQPPPPAGASPKYVSLVQSFKLVLREEGWRALYGGMSPHLLRVVPNAVTMFWVYERVLNLAEERMLVGASATAAPPARD
ncbi:hypothetical protein JCM11491_002137 [Sporobolomyces phaffii]